RQSRSSASEANAAGSVRSAGCAMRAARSGCDVMGQIGDRRVFEDKLRRELPAEPLLQFDDEIGRRGRVETHLRKGRIRADLDRRVVDGALEMGNTPVADVALAYLIRQPTLLRRRDGRTTDSGIGPRSATA